MLLSMKADDSWKYTVVISKNKICILPSEHLASKSSTRHERCVIGFVFSEHVPPAEQATARSWKPVAVPHDATHWIDSNINRCDTAKRDYAMRKSDHPTYHLPKLEDVLRRTDVNATTHVGLM